MTKGIRQVRRAIKQRKKQRRKGVSEATYQTLYPTIQDEEKHGFQPSVYEYVQKRTRKSTSIFPHMTMKVMVCLAVFISTAFILSNESERLFPAKAWLSVQLQEEFPFAKAHAWYESTFGGTPLSISPQGSKPTIESDDSLLPVMGEVVETFQTNGTGLTISPQKKSAIKSFDDGIVIFAGNDNETNKTITIQHADGTDTTYGHLEEVEVHAYQQVQANQTIGTFSPTEANEAVYFSVMKDNEYIDPAKVIPVDDLP